jgi:hypothetical protein
MSSYELLELLYHMPDRGAFKTATRDGDPCEEGLALRQIANELAVLRSAYVPKAKGDRYGARMYLSPSRLRDMVRDEEDQGEVRESVYTFADRTRTREGPDLDELDVMDEGVADA